MSISELEQENAKGITYTGDVDSLSALLTGAEDSNIKGNVKSEGNVLSNAKNSFVKGNVKSREYVLLETKDSYVEGDVESRGSVLSEAKNSHVEGDVKSERAVLCEAKDSYVEGNVKSGRGVLSYAEGSHVEGWVKSEGNVLLEAKDSFVKGNVKSRGNVLYEAKGSYVEGDVESGEGVLWAAKDSYVEGNVKSGWGVLFEAKDSYVEGDVESIRSVLYGAKDSYVEGNVESERSVLSYAEDSYVEGDVESGEGVLSYAKNSYVEGNVESGGDVLFCTKNSYVVAEKLKATSIGINAKGGLAAAQTIVAEKIGKGLTIITQSGIAGTVKYIGDWKELSGFLSGEFKKENFGALEALKLFKVGKKQVDFRKFRNQLTALNRDFAPVKDAFEEYCDLEGILNLGKIWERTNFSKKNYLNSLDKKVNGKLKDKLKISHATAYKIAKNAKRKDMIAELSNTENEAGNFAKKTGMSIDAFFKKYSNRKASDFDRTYTLNIRAEASAEGLEQVNRQLYSQGLELLEQVRSGIGLDMSDDTDIKAYLERKKELGVRIGDFKRAGKEAEELIKEKVDIEAKVNELKVRRASKMIGKYGTGIDSVKECLSQLSQHCLGGKHKQMAEEISGALIVKENEINSNVLRARIWNKNISDVPTYDEFRCCGFLGYEGSDIFSYMASNAIELMRFDIGDRSAMAIMAKTRDKKGKDVLLVDSVESASHMLGREEVSAAVAGAIEEYAREKGFAKVVYSSAAGNNAPKEFLGAMRGYKKVAGLELNLAHGLDVYLEADLGSTGGYVRGLGSAQRSLPALA